MKTFILKSFIYAVLILITLELLVRVFHLTKDTPRRYVDTYGVEKWVPNQQGHSVTGNRRQNVSEYHINSSGFNSYHEYHPSKDRVEAALVGDSFIEGFHQPYYNSLGKKIEQRVPGIEVYEYGYAGYDMADQLHLIAAYKKDFQFINYVFINLNFDDDLRRGTYSVLQERMRLESPKFRALRQIKLLVYLQSIGLFDAPRNLLSFITSGFKSLNTGSALKKPSKAIAKQNTIYLKNFESLIETYGFDKARYVFLLDGKETPGFFLTYLKQHHFKYLDFSVTLAKSKTPTTLIYDMHWNNHGRERVAQLIADYIKTHK